MLESLYPRLVAFHNWFDRRRDPNGDHLVSLIHPWEAGADCSPRWDRAMKLPAQFPPALGTTARKNLAALLPEYDHDPLALAQAGHFFVTTVDFNAIRAADLEALSRIACELGKPADASHWRSCAQAVQHAVQTRLMQPAPHDLEGLNELPIQVDSVAYFIALFGGCATPAQAARLVERLQQPDFWTAYPIPNVPISSPAYSPNHYWRGNVWMPINYMIYIGLRRYGYFDLASQLAAKTLEMARLSGYREYYHPQTGEGLGAKNQSWLALLLEMISEERNMEHEYTAGLDCAA
jgi:alpha,alpha-trehalase